MENYKGYVNPQLVISANELKGTLDDDTTASSIHDRLMNICVGIFPAHFIWICSV